MRDQVRILGLAASPALGIVVVIEHYEPMESPIPSRTRKPTYDLVTFTSWKPRRIWLGGQERLSLSEPILRHMPEAEVRELLKDEAGDLP